MKQKGQALIELLFAGPILVVSISSLLLLCLMLICKVIGGHILYEGMLCTQTYPKQSSCELTSRQKAIQALPLSQVRTLVLTSSRARVNAEMKIIVFRIIPLTIRDSVQLPLQINI